jgi:hypothetical protein
MPTRSGIRLCPWRHVQESSALTRVAWLLRIHGQRLKRSHKWFSKMKWLVQVGGGVPLSKMGCGNINSLCFLFYTLKCNYMTIALVYWDIKMIFNHANETRKGSPLAVWDSATCGYYPLKTTRERSEATKGRGVEAPNLREFLSFHTVWMKRNWGRRTGAGGTGDGQTNCAKDGKGRG